SAASSPGSAAGRSSKEGKRLSNPGFVAVFIAAAPPDAGSAAAHAVHGGHRAARALAGGVVAAAVGGVAHALALRFHPDGDARGAHAEGALEVGGGIDAELVQRVVRAQQEAGPAGVGAAGGGRGIA